MQKPAEPARLDDGVLTFDVEERVRREPEDVQPERWAICEVSPDGSSGRKPPPHRWRFRVNLHPAR